MPDLKITEELALKALGAAADRAQESLRSTAERLTEELRQAHDALTNPTKLDVAGADAAVVIDFFCNYDYQGGGGQIALNTPGSNGSYAELRSPLPRGRYRALILINRLPEALDTSR